jgi:hypothetical protein
MRANTASQVKEPFASITVNFSGIVHLAEHQPLVVSLTAFESVTSAHFTPLPTSASSLAKDELARRVAERRRH